MAVSMNAQNVTSNTKRGVIGGFISAHGEFTTTCGTHRSMPCRGKATRYMPDKYCLSKQVVRAEAAFKPSRPAYRLSYVFLMCRGLWLWLWSREHIIYTTTRWSYTVEHVLSWHLTSPLDNWMSTKHGDLGWITYCPPLFKLQCTSTRCSGQPSCPP